MTLQWPRLSDLREKLPALPVTRRSFRELKWFLLLWMIRPYVFLFRWRHVNKNRSRSERFVSLKWWEINSDSSSTNLITFCTHSDCLWHSRLWGELPTEHHRHTAWSRFFHKIWGYTCPSVYNHIHKYMYIHDYMVPTWLHTFTAVRCLDLFKSRRRHAQTSSFACFASDLCKAQS